MDNIEVIFFDLFFTLVVPHYKKNEEDNEYYDLNLTREEWEKIAEDEELYFKRASGKLHNPADIINEILRKNDIFNDDFIVKMVLDKRIKRFKTCLEQVDKNIINTLEYLSRKGKRMCLISNADVIDKVGWESSPLSRFFENTIFSCDVSVLKPNKEIYQIALNKMKVKAGKSVFIGDGGSSELKGAREAGINTILVTHFLVDKKTERIENNENYADVVIDEFDKIIKHIL